MVASEVLAKAAFKAGFEVSSFPFFGVERRGAPVTAFTRLDNRPIRVKSGVYEPDYVVVLDNTLLKGVDVLDGLKQKGKALINGRDKTITDGLPSGFKYFVLDATGIALHHGIGTESAPIVNTAIMGGFARMCDLVPIQAILDAIREEAPAKEEENVSAAKEAFQRTVEVGT